MTKMTTYLFGFAILIILTSCQKKSDQENAAYTLPYTQFLKSTNFVYVYGETSKRDSLGDDAYLEDNLNYILETNDWVLVNFCAYWCKDCRKYDPDFQEVSRRPEYKDIIFAYAEMDGTKGNENFRKRFKLPGTPVTILFHRGHIVEVNGETGILFGQRGDKTKQDLLSLLEKFYKPAVAS